MVINQISKTKGNPCINKSNQSASCMPLAPPYTHFNLPQTCGSGANGARPKVRQSIMAILKSLNNFKVINLKWNQQMYQWN